MFCNFYPVKNCKIAKNSVSIEAREKASKELKAVDF
jgi:hypothetical protein